MVAPIINMPNTQKHSGVSGIPTQLLVLHSGESPLRGGYAQSLTNWANTTPVEASWHWFVDPTAIVAMVDPNCAAWHASEANPMSEGFEQAGYARFSRAEWLTAEGLKQIENLAWLMAQRAKANGIPMRWLTTAEVEAVTHGGNRSIKGFCLHRQIDPDTRTDPGDNYPFDVLTARINAYMGSAAVAPQSTKEDTLSAAEVKQINAHATAEADRVIDYIGKLLVAGYNMGDQKLPGGNAVNIVTQQRVSAILALVTKSLERTDLTAEQITEAVKAGLADGLDLDATVTVKKAV